MLTTDFVYNDLGALGFNHGIGDLFQIETLETNTRGRKDGCKLVVEALKATPKRCHAIWGQGPITCGVVHWAGRNGFKQTTIPDLYKIGQPGIVCNRLFLRVATMNCPEAATIELENYLCPVVSLDKAECVLINMDGATEDQIRQANESNLNIFYWHELPKEEGWPRLVFDDWARKVFA